MQFSTAPFLMIFLPIVIIVYKIGGGGISYIRILSFYLQACFFMLGENRFLYLYYCWVYV